jgi:hypothetical protein
MEGSRDKLSLDNASKNDGELPTNFALIKPTLIPAD